MRRVCPGTECPCSADPKANWQSAGAMCYLELACVVPLSGGETVYLKAGLGDFMSFMFSWLRGVVLGPTR